MTLETEDCQHDGIVEIRRKTYRNGSINYVQQCLICGERVSQSLSHEFVNKEMNGRMIAEFDDSIKESRLVDFLAQRDTEKKEWWAKYNKYLFSDKWENIRHKVLIRDNYICQGCGESKATQAHHLTYDNVFNEFLFELISLCVECHERYHTK